MMNARLVVGQFPIYCKEVRAIFRTLWTGGRGIFTVNRIKTGATKTLSSEVNLMPGPEQKGGEIPMTGLSVLNGTFKNLGQKCHLDNCPLVKAQVIKKGNCRVDLNSFSSTLLFNLS
jgi:hypothetical protein